MLKGRLLELAQCYEGEGIIWDIGCDHGLLGSSFAENPQVREVHLVDPSFEVIKILKQNKSIDSYITKGRIFLHHNHGQEIRIDSKNNLIFIAGMGGKEIISILSEIEKNCLYPFRAVISPHKNILELRGHLRNSKLRLEKEFLIKDQGRFYQVLCLDFQSSESVSEFGDELWRDPRASSYRDYLLSVYASHQDSQGKAYFSFLKSLTF